MAAKGGPAPAAAPVQDTSRFVVVYPAYLDAKKTVQQGRRVNKSFAPETPTAQEMLVVAKALGLNAVLEVRPRLPFLSRLVSFSCSTLSFSFKKFSLNCSCDLFYFLLHSAVSGEGALY